MRVGTADGESGPMRRIFIATALLCSIVVALLSVGAGRPASTGALPPRMPAYGHIFLLVLENHNSAAVLGNAAAPRLNALARDYGLATNYYGVTHPSEPNYVAMIGGDYFGIQDDGVYSDHTIAGPSLVDQLEGKRFDWRSYQQSLPYAGYTGEEYPGNGNALYASKHDPFLNFARVQDSRTELRKIVPDSQLMVDLRQNHVAAFSLIVPDQCHDMHGGQPACPYANAPGDSNDVALIAAADSYVGAIVRAITGARLWRQGNNAIVITWDENDGDAGGTTGCCRANPGGGKVATIVIANHGPRRLRDNTPYNHYSLLRTIEDAFRLGCLRATCDTAQVKPMTRLFLTHNGAKM